MTAPYLWVAQYHPRAKENAGRVALHLARRAGEELAQQQAHAVVIVAGAQDACKQQGARSKRGQRSSAVSSDFSQAVQSCRAPENDRRATHKELR